MHAIYCRLLSEQFFRNSAFVIAAAVALIFSSTIALIFATAAGIQLLTIVGLKIYELYDEKAVLQIQLDVLDFRDKFPLLQIIGLIVMVVFFFFFPPISGIIGAALGFYAGLLTDVAYFKRIQTISLFPQEAAMPST